MAKKKITKKPASAIRASAGKEKVIGKITHYFSKIKVAVIKLSAPLKEGDKIKIIGRENAEFKQEVKSMQIDHKTVKTAKKGKSIGLKVSKKAREGYKIYKI